MNDALVDRYLARLGFTERPPPDGATLARLHRRHVHTLAFENLCLHLPEVADTPDLDPARLGERIVGRAPGRGGYCFELNSTFGWLLAALGYEVITGAARAVALRRPAPPGVVPLQPMTHMVLFVDLPEGRHLVDVGFGPQGLEQPLPLRHLAQVEDMGPRGHRLRRGAIGRQAIELPGEVWYLQVGADGTGWQDLYCFGEERYLHDDYAVLDYYVRTSPDCFVTQLHFWSLPLEGGGYLELGRRTFTRFGPDGSVVERVPIADLDDVRRVLGAHGVVLR